MSHDDVREHYTPNLHGYHEVAAAMAAMPTRRKKEREKNSLSAKVPSLASVADMRMLIDVVCKV